MEVNLVKLIGIMLVALGGMYLVKPALMKKNVKFWKNKRQLYLGAALSISTGLLFIKVSYMSQMAWLIFVLGLLSIIKGLVIFVLKPKDMKSLLEMMNNMPASKMRMLAFSPLIIGALIIYSL